MGDRHRKIKRVLTLGLTISTRSKMLMHLFRSHGSDMFPLPTAQRPLPLDHCFVRIVHIALRLPPACLRSPPLRSAVLRCAVLTCGHRLNGREPGWSPHPQHSEPQVVLH